MPSPIIFEKKGATKIPETPPAHKHVIKMEQVSKTNWSTAEYGDGWDKIFDISPANVSEVSMKET